MRSETALPWPDQLDVTLRHPVFAERDRQLRLSHRGDGGYGPADPIPAGGDWTVTVSPPDGRWRLSRRVDLDAGIVHIGTRAGSG